MNNNLRFLFWNIAKNPLAELITAASRDTDSDVIILAECNDPNPVLEQLNHEQERSFNLVGSVADEKFAILSRLPRNSINEISVHGGLTFYRCAPPVMDEFLFGLENAPGYVRTLRTLVSKGH